MSESKRNKLFFAAIIIIAFYGVYRLVQDYLPIIAISTTYAIAIYPLYQFLHRLFRGHKTSATIGAVIFSFIIIIIPLTICGNLFINEALSLSKTLSLDTSSETFNLILDRINGLLDQLPGVNYQISVETLEGWLRSIIGPVSSFLINVAIGIGTSSLSIIANLFIFLTIIFTLLPSLTKLRTYITKISPLGDEIDQLYISRAISMTMAMLKGTFLASLVQSLIMAFFFWIAGIDYLLTLTLAMMIFGILPVLGMGLVTVPIGLWLLINGNIWAGILVLIGQILILPMVDNLLRPYLASRETSLHPALLLIGIFGGLELFGPIGFIYGPVVMILFVTTLEIYSKYYRTV